MKAALITDIDNTIFDWFGMWHASFSAMIAAVASDTGIPSSNLLDEAKIVHQKHGTSEYAFLLEELPSLISMYGSAHAIRKHMEHAIRAYRQCRDDSLVLYPGVAGALRSLHERGIEIIGFSESKLYYSSYRIKKLGLDGVVSWLYCPEDHDLPVGRAHSEPILSSTQTSELKGDFRKPDPKILEIIMGQRGFTAAQCVYIGDSKTKDIAMAIDAKVDAIWLRTGSLHVTNGDPAYDLLRRVTHWTEEEVAKERAFAENRRELDSNAFTTADSYAQVLNFFGEKK